MLIPEQRWKNASADVIAARGSCPTPGCTRAVAWSKRRNAPQYKSGECGQCYQHGLWVRQGSPPCSVDGCDRPRRYIKTSLCDTHETARCDAANMLDMTCVVCGAPTTQYLCHARAGMRPTCSNECQQRLIHPDFVGEFGESRDTSARARCERGGGRFEEGHTRASTEAIHGLCCTWCGELCDYDDYTKNAKGNWKAGNLYPTLEHVEPLSLGGDHAPDNLRIACWLCNRQHGNREGWDGQQNLFK
jgi:hypothetical protein